MSGKIKPVRQRLLSGVSLASFALGITLGQGIYQARAQEAAAENGPAQNGPAHDMPAHNMSMAEGHVADVVVTAPDPGEQKMMDVMMKTPRQGDAVTGAQAQEQQFTTLNDYAQKVPGFSPNITTPHFSRMAIRGLGTAAAGPVSAGYQSETGFVVDNVPWLQPEYAFGDWTNISSFEIGYGPAGTTGGKNTDVGAIYIQTPLPSFAQKTQLETTGGNYGHVIEKVDTTGPIIDGLLAYRVSGYYDKAQGWIQDYGSGQKYGNINRQGIRVQLLGTGDGFTDRFIVGFNNAYEYSAYGEGAGSGTANATIGNSFLVYANGTVPTSYFQTIEKRLPGWPILTTNPYAPYLGKSGPDPVRVVTVSNEANFQLGPYTLTSISAFGYFANQMYDNSDNQGLWVGNGTGDMDSYGMQTSQEIRLSSPKGERLEWTTGIYTLYESNWARMHHYQLGPQAAAWLGSSVGGVWTPNPGAVVGLTDWFDTSVKDVQAAGYVSATYHITDKLAVTGGLRNNYDIRYMKTTYTPQFVNGTTATYAQQLSALQAAGACGFCTTGSHDNYHEGVTAIYNPQYQWNDRVLLYNLVGRGDKAPTANGTSTLVNPTNPSLGFIPFFNKPTMSMDYEIGAKTNWFDNQFISNVNFYWNDLWNFQTVNTQTYQATSGQVGTQYLGNAAHVRLRGVEFIERWDPQFIPGLDLHGTGAYNEARYVSYPNAPPPNDYIYPGGPTSISLTNTRLPAVPWWTFNIGLDYARPVGQVFRDIGGSLHDHSSWTTTSYTAFTYANVDWFNKSQLTSPVSLYQYWQPAYSLVNLGVGLRTDDRNYAFTLWTKNVFNARPYTAFTVGTATTPAAVGLTEQGPRYFGATLLVTL